MFEPEAWCEIAVQRHTPTERRDYSVSRRA
jgi:hypothetical protein